MQTCNMATTFQARTQEHLDVSIQLDVTLSTGHNIFPYLLLSNTCVMQGVLTCNLTRNGVRHKGTTKQGGLNVKAVFASERLQWL